MGRQFYTQCMQNTACLTDRREKRYKTLSKREQDDWPTLQQPFECRRRQETDIGVRLRDNIHVRSSLAERSYNNVIHYGFNITYDEYAHRYPAIPPGLTVNSGFCDLALSFFSRIEPSASVLRVLPVNDDSERVQDGSRSRGAGGGFALRGLDCLSLSPDASSAGRIISRNPSIT